MVKSCEAKLLSIDVTYFKLLILQEFYNQPSNVIDCFLIVEKDEEIVEHHGLEVG